MDDEATSDIGKVFCQFTPASLVMQLAG